MRGGAKMPPPSFSFLNIFKMKKGMTLPFYDFYLLFILKVSAKFLAKLLIGSRVIVILSEGYRKIQKQKKNFSIFFSIIFFFLKQLFLQNISSIHYVEVVHMIFFIWNNIFLLVFENKFCCFFIRNYGTYFR